MLLACSSPAWPSHQCPQCSLRASLPAWRKGERAGRLLSWGGSPGKALLAAFRPGQPRRAGCWHCAHSVSFGFVGCRVQSTERSVHGCAKPERESHRLGAVHCKQALRPARKRDRGKLSVVCWGLLAGSKGDVQRSASYSACSVVVGSKICLRNCL